MAVYNLCLSQKIYRKLFDRCEEAGVDRRQIEKIFGRKKFAFLGASQYLSLQEKPGKSLEWIDRNDMTSVSPAHEFGSYVLGLRGRLKTRKKVLALLEKWRVRDPEELLLEADVGPWMDEEGRYYKYERKSLGSAGERWAVRLPLGGAVDFPNIGEFISLKRGEEILDCRITDLGKTRKATATIILDQPEHGE